MLVCQNTLYANRQTANIAKCLDFFLLMVLAFLFRRINAAFVHTAYSINRLSFHKILHQLGFFILVKVRFVWQHYSTLRSRWIDLTQVCIHKIILKLSMW